MGSVPTFSEMALRKAALPVSSISQQPVFINSTALLSSLLNCKQTCFFPVDPPQTGALNSPSSNKRAYAFTWKLHAVLNKRTLCLFDRRNNRHLCGGSLKNFKLSVFAFVRISGCVATSLRFPLLVSNVTWKLLQCSLARKPVDGQMEEVCRTSWRDHTMVYFLDNVRSLAPPLVFILNFYVFYKFVIYYIVVCPNIKMFSSYLLTNVDQCWQASAAHNTQLAVDAECFM